MNTEEMLTELFADQAEHRPDAAGVLDDLHRRMARQRRVVLIRAASAVGAAATVTAVAVGAAMLSGSPDHRSAPAGSVHPARVHPAPAHSTVTSPAPWTPTAPPPSASAAATPSLARPSGSRGYSTINAGYLPGPAKQDPTSTFNRPGFEERDWDVTVDGVAMDVIIWTETGALPARMQATGGKRNYRAVSINGHPGREFVSTNATIVAFDLGDGTIAYAGPSVTHTTGTVTTARIRAIALKVAQNMQFNRHDPLPTR